MFRFKYYIAIFTAVMLVSCYNSDENYEYGAASKFNVAELEELYTVVALNETLTIDLDVTLDDESHEIEYEWKLIREYEPASYGTEEILYDEVIGTEKTLNYVCGEKPGSYDVYVTVTNKTTGQITTHKTVFSVTNLFTDGYYVVKESNGGTDLDIHTPDGTVVANVITTSDGQPLSGKPVSMNIFADYYYFDSERYKGEGAKALGIVTEDGFQIRNTADFNVIYDQTNAFYLGAPAGGVNANFLWPNGSGGHLCTDEGLYRGSWGSFTKGTGQFGEIIVIEGGCRPNVNMICSKYNNYLFDEKNGRFISYDSNGGFLLHGDTYADETKVVTHKPNGITDKLIYQGAVTVGGGRKHYAIFEDKDNSAKRYLYEMDMLIYVYTEYWPGYGRWGWSFNKNNPISKVTTFEGTNINKANVFATNELEAEVLMYAADNKLYCYRIADEIEQPLNLTGIPAGENIVYMKNRYWQGTTSGLNYHNNLIIATQNGDKYKVYIYDINGSIPTGAPVKVLEGEGVFNTIQYIDSFLTGSTNGTYSVSY